MQGQVKKQNGIKIFKSSKSSVKDSKVQVSLNSKQIVYDQILLDDHSKTNPVSY